MNRLKYIWFTLMLLECLIVIGQEKPSSIAGSLNVVNTIIDNDLNYNQINSFVTISYSAIRGDELIPGTGNMKILVSGQYKDSIAETINERSYFLSPTSPINNSGNNSIVGQLPEKDVNGNSRHYDNIIDIGATEYSLVFNRGNGSWNDDNKWNINRIPHRHDVVTVLDEATVTTADGVCKSIILIADTGKLIINSSHLLDVKTTINNNNEDNIVIKASVDSPNGSLIFHNSANNMVAATVEMYSKAYIDKNLDDDDSGKFNWQYIGIPFRSMSTVLSEGSWWIRKFNESLNKYDKWVELTASDNLTSFKGYEIAQNNEHLYTFKGILENRDTTINLSKTNDVPYAGQHLLANPYSASIKISDLVFGGNMESTVYVYHTGSYADWNLDQNNGRLGTGKGQYLAVPQNNAEIILPEIPSMQGFIVRVTSGSGSISIPYSSATKNVSSQRVKQNKLNPYISIDLIGENSFDKLWLIHEESADRNFNNGWDGYKMRTSNKSAALFARETSGDYQVNTVDNLDNTNICFVPGGDSKYKLKIVSRNIHDVYGSLCIIDLFKNKVIELGSDTTEYEFTSENINQPQNRFRVISSLSSILDDDEEDKLIDIMQIEDVVLIDNRANEKGSYYIYNTSGGLQRSESLPIGLTHVKLENTSGIQIINVQASGSRKSIKTFVK